MKAKTGKPELKEEYPLTEKKFTQFAKALISVPKKELDKQNEPRLRKTSSHQK